MSPRGVMYLGDGKLCFEWVMKGELFEGGVIRGWGGGGELIDVMR